MFHLIVYVREYLHKCCHDMLSRECAFCNCNVLVHVCSNLNPGVFIFRLIPQKGPGSELTQNLDDVR